ncbi:hypothetical protein DY262_16810 [Hydrogenophaga borbori]|uniref:Uncharacterized protein n=1 Tax=Hydrogenophaga borbori TaxID=2294117 RepID=A0A372EG91_9BURK|nr:hypothetical protein [Hydrogenophaga borbori]RFP77415.1 hypothetical protein DY262_16810 [Hydrogenophaga borbori]
MRLTIDFRVTGVGWSECKVADEVASCNVTASYLSDALRYLVLAATAVLSQFSRVTFRFDEEPGEYRWVITSPRINEIELKILEFPELWGEKPDSEGTVLFHTTCLPITFAEAVHKAAVDVLATLGEGGYAAQWSEHPFPALQVQELARLLELENRDT